jgi:hypothetical protein
MSIEGIMRKSIARLKEAVDIIRLSFFTLLNSHFVCPGRKQKKDMMIQDGPPDIPDNIQLTT